MCPWGHSEATIHPRAAPVIELIKSWTRSSRNDSRPLRWEKKIECQGNLLNGGVRSGDCGFHKKCESSEHSNLWCNLPHHRVDSHYLYLPIPLLCQLWVGKNLCRNSSPMDWGVAIHGSNTGTTAMLNNWLCLTKKTTTCLCWYKLKKKPNISGTCNSEVV